MNFRKIGMTDGRETGIWFYLALIVVGMVAVQADLFGWHRGQEGGAGIALSRLEPVNSARTPPETLVTAPQPSIDTPTSMAEDVEASLSANAPPLVRSVASNSAAARAANFVMADGREVIRTDFDLGAATMQRSGIEVRKPLTIDGRAVGEVAITINDASRLYISAADLRRVLPQDLAGRVEQGDSFVAFDALRQSGIVIRYDPVRDQLLVST